MKLRLLLCLSLILALTTPVVFAEESSPQLKAAQPRPANELEGEPPYEMVWAKRTPEHPPLVNFDSLEGWTIEGSNGGSGELYESRKQRLWDSGTARLVYRGTSKESGVVFRPPKPVEIPQPISAMTVWIYGNNWSWVPNPKVPQVHVSLLFTDKSGKTLSLPITTVGWEEWWLVHKIVPPEWLKQTPLSLTGIQITGCANAEDNELYFEDLTFFKERIEPLQFAPSPKRGIDPFPGQSVGANTGEGRLPFPTREETILPENACKDFSTRLIPSGNDYIFRYEGKDTVVEYAVSSERPYFRDIAVRINGQSAGTVWVDAGLSFTEEIKDLKLVSVSAGEKEPVLTGIWKGECNGKEVRVEMVLRLWQKSLVVDTICRGGLVKELSYGAIAGVQKPELIALPFINYHGHNLNVLMSKSEKPFFASVWMDWYRSNASEPFAVDKIDGERVRLNGGVRYNPKTDGSRNDLFERAFITFSPTFEETLPTIANPPAKRGKEAGTRLWQESWGPENYAKEHERCLKLRAYGIEMLTQCNHEITWRNNGESFTFRLKASPGKGGDEALVNYIAGQRALGWRSGLYTNYTDFAPVNEFWGTDRVMRGSDNNLITAWPRCYSPKALFAVEMDKKLAPQIQKKYNTNAAYTDVHTSVSPWDRCDYDARVPGAGTFAATYYAFGELLLHDQDVYDGHCWSEGNHQWLYAGLCTGNYGLTYGGLKLWEYPYLPHFDLLKMHPLTVDIGIPWTGQFFTGKEDWNKPENLDKSIDQFIAATIAYGHMGWLVEEQYSMRRTCRSYYMLQPLQSRYIMEKPVEILYGTENGLISSSQAFLNGSWKQSRLHIRYANGLRVWINGNVKENWAIDSYTLPPYGWLAKEGEDFTAGSFLMNDKRCDLMSSPELVYIDGRNEKCYMEALGIETAGCVAIRWNEQKNGLSIIAVDGVDSLRILLPGRSFPENALQTEIARIAQVDSITVDAFDVEGKKLNAEPAVLKKDANPNGWMIPIVEKAIRYEIGKK